MLFSLADFRAKRILLEERGFTGLSRFTCTDEMRTKPAILFTRGHFKVLADGRTPDAKKQRTFVHSAVCAAVCGSEPAPSHCRSATWVSCCWLQSAWFGTTRSSSLQRRPRARVSRAHAGLADRWFRRHPGEGAVAEPGNRLDCFSPRRCIAWGNCARRSKPNQ